MKHRNEKGQFTIGNSAGGRTHGARNKVTQEVRERFLYLIQNSMDQLEKDLKSLEPQERIRAITDLAKIVLPSLKAIEIETPEPKDEEFGGFDLTKLSDEAAEEWLLATGRIK